MHPENLRPHFPMTTHAKFAPELLKGALITIPPSLIKCYVKTLREQGLLDVARAGSKEKGIHGGATQSEAIEHFCHRFLNSAVRTQSIVICPSNNFGEVALNLLSSFSSERVRLLDIPCGAGASTLGFLNLILFMRMNKQLPSLPLEISIIAGDLSDYSLELYRSVFDKLVPKLKSAGVVLKLDLNLWNAIQSDQTSQLCDRWLDSRCSAREHIVIVSNTSGIGNQALNEFRRSIEHISERISNRTATLLWIEHGNPGGKNFLEKVISTIFEKLKFITSVVGPMKLRTWHFSWTNPVIEKQLEGSVAITDYARR